MAGVAGVVGVVGVGAREDVLLWAVWVWVWEGVGALDGGVV